MAEVHGPKPSPHPNPHPNLNPNPNPNPDQVHGTPAKNKRGDLPTILITPEERGFDPQSLAMTRSIGDLYMQSFGVTWEPEVIAVDLQEECTELEHLTLVIASDGLWDLYETEEVFDGVVDPLAPGGAQSTQRAAAFFEHSLGQGDELFGEHTDNITQMVIYLNPAPPGQPGAKPAPAIDTGRAAEKRAAPAAAQASCFSV